MKGCVQQLLFELLSTKNLVDMIELTGHHSLNGYRRRGQIESVIVCQIGTSYVYLRKSWQISNWGPGLPLVSTGNHCITGFVLFWFGIFFFVNRESWKFISGFLNIGNFHAISLGVNDGMNHVYVLVLGSLIGNEIWVWIWIEITWQVILLVEFLLAYGGIGWMQNCYGGWDDHIGHLMVESSAQLIEMVDLGFRLA